MESNSLTWGTTVHVPKPCLRIPEGDSIPGMPWEAHTYSISRVLQGTAKHPKSASAAFGYMQRYPVPSRGTEVPT